jgi:hypothetical protein
MLYKIAEQINKEIILEKPLPVKLTARCPIQYICRIENNKFLVVIAKNAIQKFYLKRSIEKQQEFKNEFGEYYEFNMPIYIGETDGENFVIYPYFENAIYTKNNMPIKKLIAIYEKYAKQYDITDKLIQNIETDFLSTWPDEFHSEIKQLSLYKKYFKVLKQQKQLSIYKEHGDYTSNNILTVGDKYYLVDFEFAKSFQPINLDYFDYCRTAHILDDGVYKKRYDEYLLPLNECINVYINLIDSINDIIDNAYLPKITKIIESKMDLIHYVEPNFIYNRFDVMYGDKFELYAIQEYGIKKYIPVHTEKRFAVVGVWLVDISAQAFSLLIRTIFSEYPKVDRIQARYSLNFYDGLNISNHWKIDLPDTIIEFDKNLSSKTRYNTKWYPKKINADLGGYEIQKYSSGNIPDEIIEKYFYFKKKTHNAKYKIQAQEYLRRYFVTHAYVLKIAEKTEAILFLCDISSIVYLENLTFNQELSGYSLGMVLYYFVIGDLINSKKINVYLGDGNQEYKRRFNGINQLAFDGYIIRKSIVNKLKECLKRKIRKMLQCF